MGALFSAGNTVKRRQDNPMGWVQQPARLWTSLIGMLLTKLSPLIARSRLQSWRIRRSSYCMHRRDVKRAHRDRAARLQTSEDPLQVSSADALQIGIPSDWPC